MKKLHSALLAAAISLTASFTAHAIDTNSFKFTTQPGLPSIITHVDNKGEISRELVKAVETPEMKMRKSRLLADAAQTYTLTVKAVTGENEVTATPYVTILMRDAFMNWNTYMQEESAFEVPAGDYVLAVVYTEPDFATVYLPVSVSDNQEVTVNYGMANKKATAKIVLPDGEDAVFADNVNDGNLTTAGAITGVMYKDLVAYNNMVVVEGGGEEYINNFSVRSNVTDDAKYIWTVFGLGNANGYAFSIVKDGTEVNDGDIYQNDIANYVKYDYNFTPALKHDEWGGRDTRHANYQLMAPSRRDLFGVGQWDREINSVYTCDPVYDDNEYRGVLYLRTIEYQQEWTYEGTCAPAVANTAEGKMHFATQYQSNNYLKSDVAGEQQFININPYFSFKAQDGQSFGSTAAYGVTYPTWNSYAEVPFYSLSLDRYYGNYGEVRGADVFASGVKIAVNGETQDLTGYNSLYEWQEAWAKNGHEPGTVAYTFVCNNGVVDDLDATNELTITVNETADDVVPPTIQRIMFCDAEGQPSNRFDMAEEAIVKFTGGDFVPQSVDVEYSWGMMPVGYCTYQEATIVAELAATGTTDFTEISLTEDPSKFVMPGFGAYWEASLADFDGHSDNGWFDLRVTLTDADGNTQSQVISPAVYLGSNATGIDSVDTDEASGITAIYDITGRKLGSLQQGINIVRRANGSTSKIMVK